MPHHSAEEMNIAVGLRASITQRLASFIFFWPLVLVGFEPHFLYTGVGFHLFLSLWHHTEVIRRFPKWFEWFFNTPSHHRVHHGMNAQYLDKNFSEMLIIWDRIFGTWEEEIEPPAYGVLDPPRSWNPVFINFQHWIYLCKMSWQAPHFIDKIKIWFMPPEWKPRGLEGDGKPPGITREEQVRYKAKPYDRVQWYLILQVILGFALMGYVIAGQSPLTPWERVGMSGWLWLMILSWGGLLEQRKWAKPLEVIRLLGSSGSLVLLLQKYSPATQTVQITVISVAVLCSIWVVGALRRNGQGAEAQPATA